MTAVLTTGYNVGVVPCLAQAFQRLYITNDFDLMQVTDDGINFRPVGIAYPTNPPAVGAAAGTGVDPGTHLVRYRYQDQARSRLSDPSDAVSITINSGTQILQVTPTASVDPTVTNIIIEMTPAGEGTFYRAAVVANASALTAITEPDINLVDEIPTADDGDFQHQPPPLCALVLEHRGRVWTWGATVRSFTATVTNGSPTVTGTGFSPNWAGRQMVGPDGATYQITGSTTTTITLATNYAGPNTVGTITVKSGSQGMLGWSRATFPESFDPTSFARLVTLDSGDTPAAFFSYYSDLYLCGTRSMRRLVFTGDPGAGMLLTVPGTMGAFHQRCVCAAGPGLVFGWGRDGMWMIDAMQPKKISIDIETTIAGLADNTQTAARFVVYEPVAREVLFFFVAQGETGCRIAAAYLPETGDWQLWRYRQAMTCGCPNSAYKDRQRLLLADVNGYSWRSGVTGNDGEGSSVVTVLAGTTSTVIQGANSAQVGQMAYRPATGEERVVSAASPSQFTVAAFASTPGTGELIYIGSIAEKVYTGWFIGADGDDKMRPEWLRLTLRGLPGTTLGTGTVQYFKDYDDSTPLAVTSLPQDLWPSGVYILNGDNKITVDFDAGAKDAFIQVPVPDTWERAIRAVLTIDQPQGGVRLLDLAFVFATRLSSAPVENE